MGADGVPKTDPTGTTGHTMTKGLTAWYAYFRFYTPDSDISTILDKYCGAGWRAFTPCGYNVKEYQVYTDNIAALSTEIAAINGYLVPVRETGFIDSCPSDGVVNLALKMAKYQKRFTMIEEF